MDYNEYSYEGPVLEFGKIVAHKWSSSTYAPNERKARSNLAFQFKKAFNRIPSAKITLPGEIRRVTGKENAS